MEDNSKALNSNNFSLVSYTKEIRKSLCRENIIENKQLKKHKKLIHTSDKTLKGTVVNRALPSFRGGVHVQSL